MIHWLIDVSLRNRFLIIAGFILLGGWGYWVLRTVPIDAIPDLSDNQVTLVHLVFLMHLGSVLEEGHLMVPAADTVIEEEQLMQRVVMGVVCAVMLLASVHLGTGWGADLKVIQTQQTKEMVVTLLSESGQWTQGKNTFVLEFTAPTTKQPVDAGKVTLNTVMPMPGMTPMLAGATLSPDKVPGRYLGTISFPDSGARQVTVSWDGPAGKGSTRFSVPVR